jgi:hypothetical protein
MSPGLVLAALARRNLPLGRSDRAAARTLAVAVDVVWTARQALASRSPMAALDIGNGPGLLAQSLLFGLFGWVAYLGFEPQFRRAWPHMLITSPRLLEGRWRDPLVGRAVLAGVLIGLVFALPESAPIYRVLDLPGGGPTGFLPLLFAGCQTFVESRIAWVVSAMIMTVLWMTVLLVARLIARRADAARVIFAVLMVGFNYLFRHSARPAAISPLVLLGAAAVFCLLMVWLLWKHGALALAVAYLVSSLTEQGPWTLDLSRWYAWRQWFVVAIIAALAVLGFRNVLGRQSAFPTGALDG